MLGIPLITDYIHKVVKPEAVSDSVDYLNYYCTSLLLAMAALAISAKQYFGSPIQCWVPMEFRGGWEKYTEDYCFIQNSYYVPFEQEEYPKEHARTDQLSYYRWVPIVLALQALMFYAPNYFWNMVYKQTAVQPRWVVKEAEKCSGLHGTRREEEVRSLAEYISDMVSVFAVQKEYGSREIARSGRNATFLYLFTKLLYAMNIILQLYILNHFLGGHYLAWGFETAKHVIAGEEWEESAIFPRVIMCDFQVRRLANIQRHTVQCVIMMNMINEKLYFFLWFWFLFVGVCTLVNFFYYFTVMSFPYTRSRMVLWNLSKKDLKMNGVTRSMLKGFIHDFLRPDGVLLLKFVNEHVGGRVSRELVNELVKLYIRQAGIASDNDSDLKRPPSLCLDDKAPLTKGKPDSGYFGNFDKDIQPGYYHPPGPYPVPRQVQDPSKAYESAPALEEFIDGTGTLPIGAIARQRAIQQPNTSENAYGSPPLQRQTTPTEV